MSLSLVAGTTVQLLEVQIGNHFRCSIGNIFLPISFDMYFEYSKELSHLSTHNICFGLECKTILKLLYRYRQPLGSDSQTFLVFNWKYFLARQFWYVFGVLSLTRFF